MGGFVAAVADLTKSNWLALFNACGWCLSGECWPFLYSRTDKRLVRALELTPKQSHTKTALTVSIDIAAQGECNGMAREAAARADAPEFEHEAQQRGMIRLVWQIDYLSRD